MSRHRQSHHRSAARAQPPPPPPTPASVPSTTADAVAALQDEIAALRADVNARLDRLALALQQLLPADPEAPAEEPPGTVGLGDAVIVPRLGGIFTVVEVSQSGQIYKVQAGTVRVVVRRDEITLPTGAVGRAGRAAGARQPELNAHIPEIDLHGFSEQEALVTLELFLHHNALQRTLRVRVIHGKGTGVLRAAVRRMLTGHPLVRAIDSGPQYAGDDGVTLVDLDV